MDGFTNLIYSNIFRLVTGCVWRVCSLFLLLSLLHHFLWLVKYFISPDKNTLLIHSLYISLLISLIFDIPSRILSSGKSYSKLLLYFLSNSCLNFKNRYPESTLYMNVMHLYILVSIFTITLNSRYKF